ncbi:MAG: hypothetical protein L3J20_03995 [Flavobacteriaceae bacterium]|nr:hypothetical protein [Flavobacteriaceae bacterium]
MKNLKNLGTVLNKVQQKQILGGMDEEFRRPCIVEEAGGKCCYTIESHIDDNWVKEKICIGGYS